MDDLIPIVAIFFSVGVPVMAIAGHFVLRPLVRDIVSALRGGTRDDLATLQEQITELREEMAAQETQIAALAEAESFRRQLEAKRTQPSGAGL